MAAPDDGVYLPVPVARLIERMPAVVDAYGDERRRGYGMEDALIRAVYASFDDSPTTADEILGFMARGWDHTVPPEDAEAGRALFAETCSKCEMVYIAFPEGRPNGSPTPTPPPKAQAARLPTPRTAPPAGPPDPAGSNSRAWAAILLVLLGVMGLVILFGREAPPADVSAVSQPGVPVCADLVGKTITGDVNGHLDVLSGGRRRSSLVAI